jgi:hypothetical protein
LWGRRRHRSRSLGTPSSVHLQAGCTHRNQCLLHSCPRIGANSNDGSSWSVYRLAAATYVLHHDSCRAVNCNVQHRVACPALGCKPQKHMLLLTTRQATTSICTGSFWRPVPPPEVQAQVKGCSTYEKPQKAGNAFAQLPTQCPPTGCSLPPWLYQWPLPPQHSNMNHTDRALLQLFSRP